MVDVIALQFRKVSMLLAALFAATLLAGPPPGTARYSARSLRDAVFSPRNRVEVEKYEGYLLGVSASVELDRKLSVATIDLKGWPLGGHVHGHAAFSANNEIVLDDEIQAVLNRRFVKITSVESDEQHTIVTVGFQAPVIGTRHITLHRVAPTPP